MKYWVPKFGDWDGSIPYTQYFEVAQKGKRGSKTNNQNDPCDNHQAFSTNATGFCTFTSVIPIGGQVEELMDLTTQSTIHPFIPVKWTMVDIHLQMFTSDNLCIYLTCVTCGIVYYKINKGSAFPKFGEWDESNPSSADGFTGIFNKVREGNQLSSATVPNVSSAETYANYHGSTDESLVS
ncbi:uncharacterized protein LOC122050624 [Zingiber officinale]|uniref:uncharacterized protein LOC122050624 n=1 Tax=Zingiber officinale TaxID=94328 RepID=UPI001C4D6B67|nr:uncharacterized protein LOC122050624 [Zingiber officinale]